MNRLSILAALAAASFSITTSAAVYRWVDGEGHVHYTDRAVPNSEPVDIHTGQPRQSVESPTGGDPSLTTDQLALKKSECEQKKKQYASYRSATKVVETDSLGRGHEYSPDEMKLLIERSQQAMQETCGAAGISTAAAVSTPPATPPAAPAPAPQH
jgi:hypothetical protein